ncbi:MAG TPA: ABC transporter permease [Candidatus Limnocylindria bacterium]|nr:ABC transporter permease [Candidatus Limnocylindria bacterium]
MSRLPFELSLALRYLRPKRTFVSVITLISIIGVMLGIAVLMIVIAVMSGFDLEWRERILGATAHLKIEAIEGLMRNHRAPAAIVERDPLVKGVAPFVLGPAMLQTQPLTTDEQPLVTGAVLRGIDPDQEAKVSVLPKSIVAGEFDVSGHGLLVGSTLAHNMRIRVGDHLALITANTMAKWEKARKKDDEIVVPQDFTVRGIFSVGFDSFDRMMVVSSLETAQELQMLDDRVHGLFVMLSDPFRAEEAASRLQKALGPNYEVIPWMQENKEIFGALATEKVMMYIILFVVMIVAAFAIVNSEITFAVNKIKEIGLLKSLGASNRQVMWIFLGHSIAIGILGVGLGFALGKLFLMNMNTILHAVRDRIGFELLPAAIYNISEVPYKILPTDIAIICGGGFLICVLAGLLPAWKASRLQPVEALRNE